MDDLRAYINQLREDFSKDALDEKDVDPLPSMQFQHWLKQAVEARITEVQAMTLSTVSPQGRPSGRIVYLREFERDEFWFYTNYQSRKAIDLEHNPSASILFYWKELERQVRIDGTVHRAAASHSDAYFNQRPFNSKIGAWASEQSRPLKSRAELEKKISELSHVHTESTIRRPDFWGGYVLKANYYEFWQGRPSRLHDRISYRLNEKDWVIERLYP